MIKSDLVSILMSENPHLTISDSERVIDTFFDEISDALVNKGRVELRGFGAFSIRERDERISRNPTTGARVEVPKKLAPFFKAGKGISQRLNDQ